VKFGKINSSGLNLRKKVAQFLNTIIAPDIRISFVPFFIRNKEDNRKKLANTKFNQLLLDVFDKENIQQINSIYSNIWCKTSSAVRLQGKES
jgi:TRAP-type C4-dicarboxylate transport system substrate-binding protein